MCASLLFEGKLQHIRKLFQLTYGHVVTMNILLCKYSKKNGGGGEFLRRKKIVEKRRPKRRQGDTTIVPLVYFQSQGGKDELHQIFHDWKRTTNTFVLRAIRGKLRKGNFRLPLIFLFQRKSSSPLLCSVMLVHFRGFGLTYYQNKNSFESWTWNFLTQP